MLLKVFSELNDAVGLEGSLKTGSSISAVLGQILLPSEERLQYT